MRKSYYQKRKAEVRNDAMEWQNGFADNDYSYGEIASYQDYFERLAKRYGLVKEFRETGLSKGYHHTYFVFDKYKISMV